MNLADLFFLFVFLPICLLLYYIKKDIKYRNMILIIFSLVFYAWGSFSGLLTLCVYTLMNFALGQLIEKNRNTKIAKAGIAFGIVADLGLLLLYKYTGFIFSNINGLFKTDFAVRSFLVPLGLSFFTFRTISYLLDIYWEKIEAEESFVNFLLFESLFPCAVAGPIARYSTIGEQLSQRTVDLDGLYKGATRICIGLAKKVILADSLYTLAMSYWDEGIGGWSLLEIWYSLIVYTLYVYFDFCGYSDMAIGLGNIFGFTFDENFNYPFMCTTISEFWQRWHMSLGTFFRDYLLYVPIFGKMRRYGGLFLVWFSTGLWHGASWNYILWGLYYGLFILIEQLIGKKRLKKIPLWLKHVGTKFIIIIGFGIFGFTELGELGELFKGLAGLGGGGFCSEFFGTTFINNITLFAVSILATFPVFPWITKKIQGKQTAETVANVVLSVWCIIIFAISVCFLVNATSNAFLYAQF